MKIITYFGFTLLSILIQFCVMDFIQSHFEKEQIGFDATNQTKRFNEVVKNLYKKPHALYYRNINMKGSSAQLYNNVTLSQSTEMSTTDSPPSTIFDLIYEEDNSTETAFTETLFTSTEVINVTEFTLFDKKNSSVSKTNIPKKISRDDKCACNLLYKVCDINCCCDNDCTELEHKLFNCQENYCSAEESKYFCYAQTPFVINKYLDDNELFDVVKSNLPAKRKVNIQRYDTKSIESVKQMSFKWHHSVKNVSERTFTREQYRKHDPVWLMKNGSLYNMVLPFPTVNNYCSGKTSLKFLKNEKIKCNVKLKDLEMFQIVPTAQEMNIISATDKTINSTTSNCSTVYCTNWTIVRCDGDVCNNYNSSLHEPFCTDNFCTNIALSIDIIFHYFESKITNASIKLYMQSISIVEQFFLQKIKIKFYMSNQTEDKLIKLSGNPGYLYGLPLIATNTEDNYTKVFYEPRQNRYLLYPNNKLGRCTTSNLTQEYILFGVNKRIKCRLIYTDIKSNNNSGVCELLQSKTKELFRFNNKISISPYGDPKNLQDEDWIPLKIQILENVLYEELKDNSLLACHNLITRVSFIFTYADTNVDETRKQNKILSAEVDFTTENVTVDANDPSVIITVDITFIDATYSPMYEYAKGPDLNIHLPNDFFFPFPSSQSYRLSKNKIFLCLYVMLTLAK